MCSAFALPGVLDRLRADAEMARPSDCAADVSAAVALILRDGDEGAEVLFSRRAEYPGDPWSGDTAFPGGKRDPNDASPLATALRETREEIGWVLDPDDALVGRLEDMQTRSTQLRIARVVFCAGTVLPVFVLSAEVQETFWISLAALSAPDYVGTAVREYLGQRREFPEVRVRDHTVSGLTLRMVQDVLRRLAGR